MSHDLLALLREARTELARMDAALRRLTTGHAERLIANIDKAVEALSDERPDDMKCKTTDCWLCHGTPKNAGPR